MTSGTLIAMAAALPWVVGPAIVLFRLSRSRHLDAESDVPPSPAPPVAVIIPARDEAGNIGRCVRAALAFRYPAFEVIVVDDHSRDGTADVARAAAAGDARLRVVANPDLPDGWFGKQWACATGAGVARADAALLLFLDADTTASPDLVPRMVNAARSRAADLLSVMGRQELASFWERVVQPHVFIMLATRYGGTETINRSRRVVDKIANGQCLMVRREVYDALGGHGAVRDKVAEDLALAQRWFAAGRRPVMIGGIPQLTTRMYTSLGAIVAGWMKNVFAGGIDTLPGAVGRALYPLLLLAAPWLSLAPPLALVAGGAGIAPRALFVWGALATGANLVWWIAGYSLLSLSPLWAFLHPLGGAVLLVIAVGAVARGRRVRWKGRAYVSRL
jgi:chlorobactene glucosyltransferase